MDKQNKYSVLNRRLNLTVFLSFFTLVFLSLALILGINRLEVNHLNANEYLQIIEELNFLRLDTEEAILHQREFLATGANLPLDQYNTDVEEVKSRVSSLRVKLNSATQLVNFESLTKFVDLLLQQLSEEVAIKQNNEIDDLNERILSGSATNLANEIALSIEDISVEALENLRSEVENFASISVVIIAFMLTGLITSALMILYLGRRIRKETKAKERLSKSLFVNNELLENKNKEYEKVAKELQSHNIEMEEKTVELERLNKVMEGRELKVAELTKEIEKYKNK